MGATCSIHLLVAVACPPPPWESPAPTDTGKQNPPGPPKTPKTGDPEGLNILVHTWDHHPRYLEAVRQDTEVQQPHGEGLFHFFTETPRIHLASGPEQQCPPPTSKLCNYKHRDGGDGPCSDTRSGSLGWGFLCEINKL